MKQTKIKLYIGSMIRFNADEKTVNRFIRIAREKNFEIIDKRNQGIVIIRKKREENEDKNKE